MDVGFANATSITDLIAAGIAAERAGIGRLWIAEQFHYPGAVVAAAAVAAATEGLEIGFGVLSPFLRHPAVIAMDLAALVAAFGHRFLLGLGAAHGGLTAHGITVPNVPVGLADAGGVIRRLLAGEQVVGTSFEIPEPGIALNEASDPMPLMVGSMGRQTLALSTTDFDGALLGTFCSPEFVASRVAVIREALARRSRQPTTYEIAAFILCSVDEDAKAALEAARAGVAFYLMEIPDVSGRTVGTGIGGQQLAMVRDHLLAGKQHGDLDAAIAAIPDDLVGTLSISGTPDQCASRLAEYTEAGLDRPILYHVVGPDPVRSMSLIADELIPAMAAHGRPHG